MASSSSRSAFGRDEMDALLGGRGGNDGNDHLFRPRISNTNHRRSERRTEQDLSTLTPDEAAALLLTKNKNAAAATTATKVAAQSRYRAPKKGLAHHELLVELQGEQQQQQQRSRGENPAAAWIDASGLRRRDDSDSGDEFASRSKPKRVKAAPQIVVDGSKAPSSALSASSLEKTSERAKAEPQVVARRPRRRYSSSSSESDEEGERERRRRGRRRAGSGGSSSDEGSSDDEVDGRRQRLLAKRQRTELEAVAVTTTPKPKPLESVPFRNSAQDKPTSASDALAQTSKPVDDRRQPATAKRRSNSSSSSSPSSSSSSDSGSSSSSSESDSDDGIAVAKPLFVPKHLRNARADAVQLERRDSELQRDEDRDRRRALESRAMVAKQVAAIKSGKDHDAMMDRGNGAIDDDHNETGGASNQPPDDDDDDDNAAAARDAWELRELARLLATLDVRTQRDAEQREYERRKRMTDEECLEEDRRAGRYQEPGSSRGDGGGGGSSEKGKFMQRFYHRGAYYMDKEEWDETDVRHKAAEYARAATGEDKIDKRQLPEVMQVKKFGFARQNNRYKGLAKEDTTDKKFEILPLPNERRKRKK